MSPEIRVLYVSDKSNQCKYTKLQQIFLIHPFPAILGAARAGDLVVILEIKLKKEKK